MAEKTVYIIDLNDKVTPKLRGVEKEAKKTDASFKSLNAQLKSMAGFATGIFGVGAMINFGSEVIQTTAKFQSLSNSIKFASDSAQQGELSMLWLSNLSKTYGLPLTELTEGFKTFQGAMMNTKFSSTQVRDMFAQVSTGATAMGLSAEDSKGVFLALGQIMSKGTVSAEELRGQIGERVPGAFSIAARAMNMTTMELGDLMKEGKIASEDFLPKFAAEMEKTFGQGALNSADSLSATMSRASSAWTEMMTAIGNSDKDGLIGSFFNTWSGFLDGIADKFRDVEELSKRAMAGDMASRTETIESQMREQALFMKKSGMSKSEIELRLGGSEAQTDEFNKKKIEGLKWQLAGIAKEQNEGRKGLFGGEHNFLKEEDLYSDAFPEYKKIRDQITLLEQETTSRGGLLDKVLSSVYMPVNSPVEKEAKKKKGRVGADGLTLNESRNGATNIVFNIDTFQKNEISEGIGMNNNAVNDFLNQMALGLQTVLNDSAIVARQ
jgi:tape measure domain-containing protein